MRADQETKEAYFNYIGSIQLPLDVIEKCHHTGDCEADVLECLERPEVKAELSEIKPEDLKKELEQHGAWDDEELNDHQENLKRILWIAAADIQEQDNEK